MGTRGTLNEQQLPEAGSVLWWPSCDSHDAVAELQWAAVRGVRVCVTQAALAAVDAHARSAGALTAVGLLLGALYESPQAGPPFLLIRSVLPHPRAVSEAELSSTRIWDSLLGHRLDSGTRPLGWYRSAPVPGARLDARDARLHATHFPERWHTALLVSAEVGPSAGGVFLMDERGSRGSRTPFYEVLSTDWARATPVESSIAWSTYAPAEPTVLLSDARRAALAAGGVYAGGAEPRIVALFRRLVGAVRGQRDERGAGAGSPAAVPVASRAPAAAPPTPAGQTEAGPASDTSVTDAPQRYLATARSAGFVMAAEFATAREDGTSEILRLLYLPTDGILLEVVSGASAVIDASIHYNVHTDDPGALQAAFEEHRDLESRTLYVKESCVDHLLATCRRLREGGRLVADWKVSPFIYFLTPGEWSSTAVRGGGDNGKLRAADDIGQQRIVQLPAEILRRTGLDLASSLRLSDGEP